MANAVSTYGIRHSLRDGGRAYELCVSRDDRKLYVYDWHDMTMLDILAPMKIQRHFAEWYARKVAEGRIVETPAGRVFNERKYTVASGEMDQLLVYHNGTQCLVCGRFFERKGDAVEVECANHPAHPCPFATHERKTFGNSDENTQNPGISQTRS